MNLADLSTDDLLRWIAAHVSRADLEQFALFHGSLRPREWLDGRGEIG